MSDVATLLIDRSIADLEELASVLADEVLGVAPSRDLPAQSLKRKEVLLTISVLLPKLAAARGGDGHLDLLKRGRQWD